MKIGFYKLGITKDMIDRSVDKNGRFEEFLALINIFTSRGHDVYVLDKNDKDIEGFHKIYVLNGALDLDEHIKELEYLRKNTLQLNYILTDLRLICDDIVKYFDIVYTQSIKPIKYIQAKQLYNGMPELAIYCSGLSIEEVQKMYHHSEFDSRKNLCIFGGGYRNRAKDIEDYIISNGYTFYGKDNKGIDNRIPIHAYRKELRNTKYSILLQDEEYNDAGFITWRYFENISNGVITFIDSKCDKDKIIGLGPLTRKELTVTSGKDLRYKISNCENNIFLKIFILMQQESLITNDKLSGEYTYSKLMQMH